MAESRKAADLSLEIQIGLIPGNHPGQGSAKEKLSVQVVFSVMFF